MNEYYIYHHLGMGDHIICNALVRNIIKKENSYKLFSKKNNAKQVRFMYKDIPNLEIIEVLNDDDVRNILKLIDNYVYIVGFQYLNISEYNFDESFYKQYDLNFSKRWDDFYIERDLNKEELLFSRFGVRDGEYVFVHDDVKRGFIINDDNIENKNIPIIRPIPDYTENIFDYIKLMLCAKELHFMDSSFRLLYDSLPENNSTLHFHKNVRPENIYSSSKKKYIIHK